MYVVKQTYFTHVYNTNNKYATRRGATHERAILAQDPSVVESRSHLGSMVCETSLGTFFFLSPAAFAPLSLGVLLSLLPAFPIQPCRTPRWTTLSPTSWDMQAGSCGESHRLFIIAKLQLMLSGLFTLWYGWNAISMIPSSPPRILRLGPVISLELGRLHRRRRHVLSLALPNVRL